MDSCALEEESGGLQANRMAPPLFLPPSPPFALAAQLRTGYGRALLALWTSLNMLLLSACSPGACGPLSRQGACWPPWSHGSRRIHLPARAPPPSLLPSLRSPPPPTCTHAPWLTCTQGQRAIHLIRRLLRPGLLLRRPDLVRTPAAVGTASSRDRPLSARRTRTLQRTLRRRAPPDERASRLCTP